MIGEDRSSGSSGGGIVAAGVLLAIASGKPDYSLSKDGLAANGYGVHSPGHYTLASGLLTEVVMTAAFLVVSAHSP